MMDPNRKAKLQELIDKHHEWPVDYCFKFIVPSEQIEMMSQLLPEVEFSTRFSEKGKYGSVSFSLKCDDAEAVMEIYEKVQNVPGLMAL